MNRCVEVDELKSAVKSWLATDKYYHPHSKGKTIPVSELLDIIDRLPTANHVSESKKVEGWIPVIVLVPSEGEAM